MKLTLVERVRFRRLFTAALCNLSHLEAYWCDAEMRLLFRSVITSKRHPIPESARLLGVYSHPFGAEDFLSDLDDVLAKIEAEELKRDRGDAQPFAFA